MEYHEQMDETRTARAIALMAGNGFFLTKVAEDWLRTEGRYHLLVSTITFAFVALVGVSLAYISLFGRSEKRWPLSVEIVSALCFVANALWWLSRALYGPTN